MVKEKKGHVKVTLNLETSPSLMDLMKEYVEKMQQTIQMIAEYQKKKELNRLILLIKKPKEKLQ